MKGPAIQSQVVLLRKGVPVKHQIKLSKWVRSREVREGGPRVHIIHHHPKQRSLTSCRQVLKALDSAVSNLTLVKNVYLKERCAGQVKKGAASGLVRLLVQFSSCSDVLFCQLRDRIQAWSSSHAGGSRRRTAYTVLGTALTKASIGLSLSLIECHILMRCMQTDAKIC